MGLGKSLAARLSRTVAKRLDEDRPDGNVIPASALFWATDSIEWGAGTYMTWG